MSSEPTSATLVRNFFERALNGRNLELMPEFCAEDYVWHPSSVPGDEVRGLDAFRQLVAAEYEAFPDLHTELVDVVAGGDRVVVRYVESGTHSGASMGLAATGRTARWDGMCMYRVEDGKLAEEWSVADGLSILRQLGFALPDQES